MQQHKRPVIAVLMASLLLLNTSCYMMIDTPNYTKTTEDVETGREENPTEDQYRYTVMGVQDDSITLYLERIPSYKIAFNRNFIEQRQFNAGTIGNFALATAAYALITVGTVFMVENIKGEKNSHNLAPDGLKDNSYGTIGAFSLLAVGDLIFWGAGFNPLVNTAKLTKTELAQDEKEAVRYTDFTLFNISTGERTSVSSDDSGYLKLPGSFYSPENSGFVLSLEGAERYMVLALSGDAQAQMDSAHKAYLEKLAAMREEENRRIAASSRASSGSGGYQPCSVWDIIVTGIVEGGAAALTTSLIRVGGEFFGILPPKDSSGSSTGSGSGQGKGVTVADLERLKVAIEASLKDESITEALFINEVESKVKDLIPGNLWTKEGVYAGAKRMWQCYQQSKAR